MVNILYNGNFITLNPSNPQCQAIAIENGVIIAAGSNDEIFNSFTRGIQKTNLEGASVLPGFTDSHIHLLHYAEFLSKIDCETASKLACINKVNDAANHTAPGEWILGHGWNQNSWPDGIWTMTDLETVAPLHLVYLTNKSLHGAWINQKALTLAEINEQTPDPIGGMIGRDPETHQPNGLLFESAVLLIESLLPPTSVAQAESKLEKAQNHLFRHGITSVHDFDRQLAFRALQNLDLQQKLKLRVHKSIPLDELDHAIGIGILPNMGNDHLHIGPVKLFMDGALGTQTAAMLEPYQSSDQMGMLLMNDEELFEVGKKAVSNGLYLAIHAIGDRANRIVINTLAKLEMFCQANHIPLQPNRIEHLQIITPEDIELMAATLCVASMQPIHLCSDMPAAEKFWGDRTANVYAFKSVLRHKIPLVFGSDAPVEQPDCIVGLHAAVNRQDRTFHPKNGWHSEEQISILEAINAFCLTPHFLTRNKSNLGKIEKGFLADLTLIDQNILAITKEKILDTKILGTMIDGNWVWQKG